MNDPHITILELHFFAHVDEGAAPEATPLFTRISNGQPLIEIISQDFDLTPQEAEDALEIARREVEL
jgi:hypothetical protein